MDIINGSKIMASCSAMDTFETQFVKKNILTFRSFANPTLCSSVKNNTFSIERSPNGVAFARFVRISLFRQMV